MKTLVKVLVGLAIHLDVNTLLPAVFKLSMYLITSHLLLSRLSLVDMVYQAQISRQHKKLTSFQPAWLITCSTPHQPSAIFPCLHLRFHICLEGTLNAGRPDGLTASCRAWPSHPNGSGTMRLYHGSYDMHAHRGFAQDGFTPGAQMLMCQQAWLLHSRFRPSRKVHGPKGGTILARWSGSPRASAANGRATARLPSSSCCLVPSTCIPRFNSLMPAQSCPAKCGLAGLA